jgi:hypothetical protein
MPHGDELSNTALHRTSRGESGSESDFPTANAVNQYTAVGSATPTWDANGNLTYDGTFTYAYDAENRLVAASGGGNT